MSDSVDLHAVVVGGGAIAQALLDRLSSDSAMTRITLLARGIETEPSDRVACKRLELLDESSIVSAAEFAGNRGPIDTLIVATGLLHDQCGLRPEKRLSESNEAHALLSFSVNALGPVLIGKHMLPLMHKNRRNMFAALSARVGSIEDNRLGGWHSYRASKAALNMFIKCMAIEQSRTNKHSIVAGLHPGTVDSRLSKPFQRNVPAGGLFTPADAADKLFTVLEGLSPEDSGGVFAWDGSRIPT